MKQKLLRTSFLWWYIGIAAVVIILLVVALVRYHQNSTDTLASASPTPTVQVTSTPSPTPSATVTATTTPTASAAALPADVRKVVDAFYASYKAKDRAGLQAYFTTDETTDLRSISSRLFTGVDSTNSVPGGPTLFSSGSVLEHPTSFSLTSSSLVGADWNVGVSEQRVDGNGKALAAQNFTLTLTKQGANWMLSLYAHSGSKDKYNGFLTQ